jgi:molybdate-binding protein/DNA-binding XRE family transcriptional regulator
MARIRSALRQVRQRQGIRQQELAARAGISRQALGELEADHSCPSTAVALALANALRCKVEDLFALSEDADPIRAEWACLHHQGQAQNESGHGEYAPLSHSASTPQRAALAFIAGRWVAHPLSSDQPSSLCTAADGLIALDKRKRPRRDSASKAQVRVRPLRSRSALKENIIAAGCDPAMGLLAAWLGERHLEPKLTWLYAPSLAALGALSRREVHIAGAHLLDEKSREFNVPFVRSMIVEEPVVITNLARWEEGFVVTRGNPLGIRGAHDLCRSDVGFINREVGSEARKLVERILRQAGLDAKAVQGFQRVAHGHTAVAQAVAIGAADVGIATRSAASALDLSFIPLSEERFDLVFLEHLTGDPRLARLMDALHSRAFRRELGSLGGYVTAQSGQVVAEVRPE